jgi:UDP-3-O-[3-hydroxymyristoyl] N-acetylglucosamine deacetylase/3-hydroxyacyl-[acyl-carrier-protein] dehydratase
MATASRLQRTIASETEVRGVGFFHGSDVTLRFRPSGGDTGVVFARTDLPGCPTVRAVVDHVVPTPRRTTVRDGEAVVEMIEHVMAALAGLRIDNCRVEVDAAETPGCDGSSRAFVEALRAAGTVELDRPRAAVMIEAPVTVRDGPAVLTAHPGGGGADLVLSYHLDYGRDSPIGSQSLFLDVNPESFADELAPSRTFLLEAEARALRQAGIGTHVTDADLLIFGPDGPIGNALRYPDECVRHKILDMVGDLALLGMDLHGHVVAHRSGHALNAALVRALLVAASAPQPGPCPDGEGDPVPDPNPEVDADDSGPATLDLARAMTGLPQRYPFVMIDRVLEAEPGRRLLAVKDVRPGDPYLQAPRSGRPVVPGVLVLEALTQAAGVLIADHARRAGKVAVVAAIDRVRMGAAVRPGDRLRLEVECLTLQATRAHVRGAATVGDRLAAEAKVHLALVDADRSAA